MAERLAKPTRISFEPTRPNTLSKDELTKKLKTRRGAADDDPVIPYVAATFLELKKLADFDVTPGKKPSPSKRSLGRGQGGGAGTKNPFPTRRDWYLLYYQLNLPATTEVEVFNAIFRSLKEHILDAD